jgi:hypothetical protein
MRKDKIVVITDEGRDKGKTFVIKEMPASQAEWWAIRVFQAVTRAGIDIPDNISGAGMAGIAMMGIRGFANLPPPDLKDLLDEMFSCIFVQRDNNPNILQKPMEEDIEEIRTRLKLREEWFELHTGFSLAAARMQSTSPAATTESNISNTQTSQEPSPQ